MKGFGIGLVVVLVALISVIVSELASIEWMNAAPFQVNANWFLTGVFPTHLVVQGVLVSVIAALLRHNARLFVGLYIVVAMGAYAAMLLTFQNPVSDVLKYELSTFVAIAIWVAVNRNRVFRPVVV